MILQPVDPWRSEELANDQYRRDVYNPPGERLRPYLDPYGLPPRDPYYERYPYDDRRDPYGDYPPPLSEYERRRMYYDDPYAPER